ncbi:MAG: transcription antitermination factor NusB [Micropruina sp.]
MAEPAEASLPVDPEPPTGYVPSVHRDQLRPDGTILRFVETVQEPVKHLSARSKARKHALDILFEADLRGEDPSDRLDLHRGLPEAPLRQLTEDLVRGVSGHIDEIDQLIEASLVSDWTLERMPRVDRCLARIAVFELLHTDGSPEVAIQQAVLLAQEFSTSDSPAFLNGVLANAHVRHRADAG